MQQAGRAGAAHGKGRCMVQSTLKQGEIMGEQTEKAQPAAQKHREVCRARWGSWRAGVSSDRSRRKTYSRATKSKRQKKRWLCRCTQQPNRRRRGRVEIPQRADKLRYCFVFRLSSRHLGQASSGLGSSFQPEVKRGRPPTAHAYRPFSLVVFEPCRVVPCRAGGQAQITSGKGCHRRRRKERNKDERDER